MYILVIVLGDVGRSPRMQYHCLSLLDAGHRVCVLGYDGETLIPALQDAPEDRFQSVRFTPWSAPSWIQSIKLLYFVWRILSVATSLLHALFVSAHAKHPVDFVLVQNPPALPLLAIAYLFCRIKAFTQKRQPGFIIDWHNLGYTMLPDGSIVQRVAKAYECTVAPLANGHLAVTKAMKEHLRTSINISTNVDVLYDCPPSMFQPLDIKEQHTILSKLDKQLCDACPKSWSASKTENQTLLTEQLGGRIRYRPGRPALVTSSTSWTADEDFGKLLEALALVDTNLSGSALKILVIVTGKGPNRDLYEQKISSMQMEHVAIATIWLAANDYPLLLACADLGVSMHTSTSGLDLPMKVLDLFGCHVPVLAHDFECLHELVQDKVNGRVFSSSETLAEQLLELLTPLSNKNDSANHSYGSLLTYSKQLQGRDRWNANWNDHAFPVILRSTPR